MSHTVCQLVHILSLRFFTYRLYVSFSYVLACINFFISFRCVLACIKLFISFRYVFACYVSFRYDRFLKPFEMFEYIRKRLKYSKSKSCMTHAEGDDQGLRIYHHDAPFHSLTCIFLVYSKVINIKLLLWPYKFPAYVWPWKPYNY